MASMTHAMNTYVFGDPDAPLKNLQLSAEGSQIRQKVSFTMSIVNLSGTAAWWTFDDPTGSTNAADSSGNNNAATIVNGFTSVPGVLGNAVDLDGFNQY